MPAMIPAVLEFASIVHNAKRYEMPSVRLPLEFAEKILAELPASTGVRWDCPICGERLVCSSNPRCTATPQAQADATNERLEDANLRLLHERDEWCQSAVKAQAERDQLRAEVEHMGVWLRQAQWAIAQVEKP